MSGEAVGPGGEPMFIRTERDYDALLDLDAELKRSRLRQEAKDKAFDALLEACRAALAVAEQGGLRGFSSEGEAQLRAAIALAEGKS